MVVNGVEIPRHGARGPCHMAFRVSENEMDDWKKQLTAKEVELEAEINWPQEGVRSTFETRPGTASNSPPPNCGRFWKTEATSRSNFILHSSFFPHRVVN
ncbi:MAG: hypothetical protein R3C11_02335 [Planctomycetaceae bacterium]